MFQRPQAICSLTVRWAFQMNGQFFRFHFHHADDAYSP